MENVASNGEHFVFVHSVRRQMHQQNTTSLTHFQCKTCCGPLWAPLRSFAATSHWAANICATHQHTRANDTAQPHPVGVASSYAHVLCCAARFGQFVWPNNTWTLSLLYHCSEETLQTLKCSNSLLCRIGTLLRIIKITVLLTRLWPLWVWFVPHWIRGQHSDTSCSDKRQKQRDGVQKTMKKKLLVFAASFTKGSVSPNGQIVDYITLSFGLKLTVFVLYFISFAELTVLAKITTTRDYINESTVEWYCAILIDMTLMYVLKFGKNIPVTINGTCLLPKIFTLVYLFIYLLIHLFGTKSSFNQRVNKSHWSII